MIHHFSISAHDPHRVASVLAEVMNGQCFPFPPHAGSFIALCEDAHATAIEVYPLGTVLTPGPEAQEAQFEASSTPVDFVPTHAAISVSSAESRIKEIANREGWRAVTCDRGGLFRVIEFWVENRMLIEFLTPEMARDYLRAVTPQKWTGYLA